jgi:hypothetical protein
MTNRAQIRDVKPLDSHPRGGLGRAFSITAEDFGKPARKACIAALIITACGGTQQAPQANAVQAPLQAAPVAPAAAEPSAATAAPAVTASSLPTAPPAQVPPPLPSSPASSSAAPAGSAVEAGNSGTTSSPSATLTATRVAFLIDYNNSDAKTKAEAACDKAPKREDAAVKAACMSKAREHFLPDVLVFKAGRGGRVTLTIYKRNEMALKEVYVAPVSLKDEGPSSVRVKFKGGGSGQRPLFKNTNSPTIDLPNDYTLEINDPEYGKLHYDAKIGLVN